MNAPYDIVRAYQDSGCLLSGHFIGTSGVHLRRYFGERMEYIPTYKEDGELCIPSELLRGGHRILVVEDNITRGHSSRSAQGLMENASNEVLCILALLNKSSPHKTGEQMGLRQLVSLACYEIESYETEIVPDDLKAVPISLRVGHGKKHQDRLEKAGFTFEAT